MLNRYVKIVFIFQLQTLVSDEVSIKFTELFFQAQKKGGTGGVCDTADERAAAEITYQKQAEKIDPEENCYKVIFVSDLQICLLCSFYTFLISKRFLWFL